MSGNLHGRLRIDEFCSIDERKPWRRSSEEETERKSFISEGKQIAKHHEMTDHRQCHRAFQTIKFNKQQRK